MDAGTKGSAIIGENSASNSDKNGFHEILRRIGTPVHKIYIVRNCR